MNRESKILLKVIFMLAVLFGPGINSYSNQYIRTTNMEHPAAENGAENKLFMDADFFDDEQINQISDFFSEDDDVYQIRIFQNCILISRYPTPIWQPPKNIFFNV